MIVNKGQVLGSLSSTTPDPHLHFELGSGTTAPPSQYELPETFGGKIFL